MTHPIELHTWHNDTPDTTDRITHDTMTHLTQLTELHTWHNDTPDPTDRITHLTQWHTGQNRQNYTPDTMTQPTELHTWHNDTPDTTDRITHLTQWHTWRNQQNYTPDTMTHLTQWQTFIPGYESHQSCRADAAAVSRSPSWQYPTQRQDFGHTMRWDSSCIPHIHSPSTSEYVTSAAPGTHPLSRTPELHSHITTYAKRYIHTPAHMYIDTSAQPLE